MSPGRAVKPGAVKPVAVKPGAVKPGTPGAAERATGGRGTGERATGGRGTGEPGSGAGAVAWLVTGDDAALVSQALRHLVDELVDGRDRSLVVEDMGGDDLDLAAVVDACQTPPFLADRRVVVVRDIGRFSADQVQPVIGYLDCPMETSRLVLAAGGGQLPAKLVTAFRQSPAATVVGTDVGAREAHDWVTGRLSRSSLQLAPAAASLLEAHLGEDLNRLEALLATLEAAYGPGARLRAEDLDPYLGQAGAVPPWDLTDAIDRGETGTALSLLHRLTDAGARHPLVVLAVLQRHYGNILRVESPSIATEGQAAEALGIAKGRSTFPARKALDSARRLGAAHVGEAVTALADAELALKGKLDMDGVLVLEILVARLSRLSRVSRVARRG